MATSVWGDTETQHFYSLDPFQILSSIDSLGYSTTGRCLQMNSMENRVFEVEIDVDEESIQNPSEKFVIGKFYRPGRWSKEQILEEHEFLLDLQSHEIPVIAPIQINGETVFEMKDLGILYSLFPKQGGRVPDEWNKDKLEQMGRLLGRVHQIGKSKSFKHRLSLDLPTYGRDNLSFLIDQNIVPIMYKSSYSIVCEEFFEAATPLFKNIQNHRTHGDCHIGNILWSHDKGPFLIDFDDTVTAPAIQDVWLIAGGRDEDSINNRNTLLDAYESMSDFNWNELKLIEPLRALRLIHFSAWIGKRWEDKSFQRAFDQFQSEQYWEEQLQALREITAMLL